MVLNIVNRHLDQPVDTEFDLEDKQFSGPVEITEVNGPDVKSENNFDAVNVKPAQHSMAAQGRRLQYRFPPHSYTMLRVKLA
jgi:alpha-N-arabinofuranosidase